MITIEGAVEKIEGAWFYGWARPGNRTGDVEIEVLRDDVVIGTGAIFFPRPDLGGQYGFRIRCAAPVDPMHVLGGGVRVVASLGPSSNLLRILPSVRSRVMAEFVTAAMRDFAIDDIDRVWEAISRLPKTLDAEHIATRTTPEKHRTLQLLERAGHRPGVPTTVMDLTLMPVEIGFVSPDGTALIGKDGEVYLVGGSNRVLEQFLTPLDDPWVQRLATVWHAAVLERARLLKASGCRSANDYPRETERLPGSVPGKGSDPIAAAELP